LHFGYVLLPDEEMVPVAVQKLNGCRFRGRDIRVEPYKATVMLETANMGTIHVTFKAQTSRISLITEATLRDYFETFGEIQQIVIRKHEMTEDGRQHGFAFVTYREHDINELVIEMVRKLLVGDILYDCAWSKQYLDSMRKDTNGHQTSTASSVADPVGFQASFKGSHPPTPIGVSRAGSLDFHDQGSVHTDAVFRNSFYGTGTPSSLSIDAYEGSFDNRWVVPTNSLDQSSVDTMGRRSETPGQGDIPGGIAFSKLAKSPSPGAISLAPSFDRQDYMYHQQQQAHPSASLTMRNISASSQQQASNIGGNNRVPVVNARPGGYAGMEHANARLSGMQKQFSAPQASLEQMQRRAMDSAPQAGGFPFSSWSADMMDDYSSSRRFAPGASFLSANVNANGTTSMAQGTVNSQKRIPDTGIVLSRNFTNGTLPVPHQQQIHNAFPPQHPQASHQVPAQVPQSSNRSSSGVGSNFGNGSGNSNISINVGHNGAGYNPSYHPANMSPQLVQTPNNFYQNLNNYSPAVSHTSGPSTAATATGYGQREIRAFSPHYGNSHLQPSPYSLTMEEMVQKPIVQQSSYAMNRSSTVIQQSSTISTPRVGVSLSHDELDDRRTFSLHPNTYNRKPQQVHPSFPQFSPMAPSSNLLTGVPRTQSESAIADSSVYCGTEHVVSGNPNNSNSQKRSWLPSPQAHQQVQYGNLPPRGTATQLSENMRQPSSSHTLHPAQQSHQQTQLGGGVIYTNRSYSGSEPVSINNSYQNSFDEYDTSHGVQSMPVNSNVFHNILENGANLGSYSMPNNQIPVGGYSITQQYPLPAAADSLQMSSLELTFLTGAGLDTPAGGAPPSISTPAGQTQRRMEELCEDLLASNSYPKDSDAGCNSANLHQLSTTSLFSLSDSSSPRLDGSQVPSLSSFSIDVSRKGTPNNRAHSSLLVDDIERDINYSYLSLPKPANVFSASKDADK
jgi:hypothetical protein